MGDAKTRLLDALYFGVADSAELKRALELIQRMFNCRAAALISLDTQAPVTDMALACGVFDEQGRLYAEQFATIGCGTGNACAPVRLAVRPVRDFTSAALALLKRNSRHQSPTAPRWGQTAATLGGILGVQGQVGTAY